MKYLLYMLSISFIVACVHAMDQHETKQKLPIKTQSCAVGLRPETAPVAEELMQTISYQTAFCLAQYYAGLLNSSNRTDLEKVIDRYNLNMNDLAHSHEEIIFLKHPTPVSGIRWVLQEMHYHVHIQKKLTALEECLQALSPEQSDTFMILSTYPKNKELVDQWVRKIIPGNVLASIPIKKDQKNIVGLMKT